MIIARGQFATATITLMVVLSILSVGSMRQAHAQSAVWIVGIDRYYPPHEYWKNGTAQGFNTDIIRAIAAKMGRTVQWVPLDWNEASMALRNGTVESLCMSVSEERKEFFDFSKPILNLTLRVFVKADVTGILTIEDLAGHTVAVEKGDVAQEILTRMVPNATVVEVETQEDAIILMARGEVTAAFCNEYTGVYAIIKNNLTNIKKIGKPVDIGPRAIAVAKGNTALLNEINYGIEQVFDSGEYDEIRNRWFGMEVLVSTVSERIIQNVVLVVGVVAVVALIMVGWNWYLHGKVADMTERLSLLIDIFKHDLRNINQTLIGSLQLLEYDRKLSLQSRETIAIALSAVNRSQKLTDDFLAIEKLTSGQIKIQPMRLTAVIDEGIQRANSMGVKVEVTYNHSQGLYIKGCRALPDALSRLLIYLAHIDARTNHADTITLVTEERRGSAQIYIKCKGCDISVKTHETFLLRYHGAQQVGVGLDLSLLHASLAVCEGGIQISQGKTDERGTDTIFYIWFKKAAPPK